MYKVIEEFELAMEKDPIFHIRGAIAPLFLAITWDDANYPLHILSVTKGRDSYMAFNERKYIAIAIEKFRRYFKEDLSIQELEKEYSEWETGVENYLREIISKDLALLTDLELQQCMVKINDLFVELANKTLYIENVDYDKILGVIGPENKQRLDDIWEKATEAAFLSFEGRRLKKLLDIVDSGSAKAVREAKFVYTDYFWTKSEGDISKELQEIKINFKEKTREFEEMYAVAKARHQLHTEWLQTLEPISRRIAEFAQLVMNMRDTRKDPIAKIHAMLAEVSVIMLDRAGVNISHAPYALIYEYLKGVDYLVSIKDSIEKRVDGCIYLTNPDFTYSTELCNFEKAIEEITAISDHTIEPSDSLKGQTACRGLVTGTVRVVFDPHEDKGFQDGDILVTSMTRPEFVPLMKRAGAVVTNEGGITCHAAIVSRELNIPCIIGTKVATKTLKDGDQVEVDATNGIVKIIK